MVIQELDVEPYFSMLVVIFSWMRSMASSQLMRSHSPAPRSVPSTRFMGYFTLSGE